MKRTEILRTVVTASDKDFAAWAAQQYGWTVSTYLQRLIRADMERHRDRRTSRGQWEPLPAHAMSSNERPVWAPLAAN